MRDDYRFWRKTTGVGPHVVDADAPMEFTSLFDYLIQLGVFQICQEYKMRLQNYRTSGS